MRGKLISVYHNTSSSTEFLAIPTSPAHRILNNYLTLGHRSFPLCFVDFLASRPCLLHDVHRTKLIHTAFDNPLGSGEISPRLVVGSGLIEILSGSKSQSAVAATLRCPLGRGVEYQLFAHSLAPQSQLWTVPGLSPGHIHCVPPTLGLVSS